MKVIWEPLLHDAGVRKLMAPTDLNLAMACRSRTSRSPPYFISSDSSWGKRKKSASAYNKIHWLPGAQSRPLEEVKNRRRNTCTPKQHPTFT
eukprot:scaffold126308_cov19-Tisochrysis_lutea.AAC.1